MPAFIAYYRVFRMTTNAVAFNMLTRNTRPWAGMPTIQVSPHIAVPNSCKDATEGAFPP